MVNQFPTILSSGAIARYPLGREGQYSTRVAQMADFSEQRFQQLAKRLMTWDITLSMLTDAEFEDILAFFDQQAGVYGTFTFIDPFENLLQYSEAFENAAWSLGSGMLVGSNYVLNSQGFDQSSWTKNTGVTVTANSTAAPDGTVTADTISYDGSGSSGGLRIFATAAAPATTPANGMPVTASVWLMVSSGTLSLQLGNNFSVTTITVTTSWQRFQISGTGSGSGNLQLLISSASGNNSSFSVFAWGAQLEFGSAASDYTPTTTATAILQIADPFFQQAPSTVPGFQWNLNSAYARRGRQLVNISTTAAYAIQNLLIAPSGIGNSRTNGMTFTGSVYFKQQASGGPSFNLQFWDSTGPGGNGFEVAIVNVAPTSSWVRSSLTKTFSASNPNPNVNFEIGGSAPAVGTVYAFGAQLEAEGTASAYKMTTNVSGVHTKAHFQTDEFAHIASEFNVNVFENSMRQRRSTLSRLSDVLTIYESGG